MKAALEHHFDNHIYCNPSWCHFREDSEKISDNTVRAKLRNLSDPVNKAIYDEVKKIHDKHTVHENLLMLMHPYDSQKNEALNRAFMKLAPKSIVFSKTFSLFDRLAFVVIIDSLGYEEGLCRLLGTIYNNSTNILSPVQQEWAKLEDTFKKYIHDRQKTKKEKIRRTSEKKKTLKNKRVKNNRAKSKGDGYRHGIAMETDENHNNDHATPIEEGAASRRRATPKQPTQCKCKATDHLRISYGKCPLNPKNIARVLEEAAAAAAANRRNDIDNDSGGNENGVTENN